MASVKASSSFEKTHINDRVTTHNLAWPGSSYNGKQNGKFMRAWPCICYPIGGMKNKMNVGGKRRHPPKITVHGI